MEKWITTREAAEISGYNVQPIRRLARGGLINSKKWGIERMIDSEKLLVYIHEKGYVIRRRPGT